MKKIRRVFALLLTIAMSMALCVPVFAAEVETDAGITTETYYLGDDIVITVTTAPNDITPMPLDYDRVLDAVASPKARHTFPLEKGEGPKCGAHVWNDSTDGTELDATFTVTINGASSDPISKRVSAGKNTNFIVENKNGEDLVGKIVTEIKAVNADSVRYSYLIEQS